MAGLAGARVAFEARASALAPSGVVGTLDVARALARRALACDDAALGALRGVAARGVVLLLGEAEDLPWVDGVGYLGCDPDAPRLLLPTHLRPSAPVAALERAILRRCAGLPAPVAVLHDLVTIVPVGGARALSRAHLRAWLAAAP